MPSAFVLSQAEIENELRKHGSGFEGGKQRIMALYQTQPDRNLRVKALAKEYGIGGDRKSTRLNSSHNNQSRMPSSA